MRKLYILILAAALCVNLAACGGETPAEPVDSIPADGEIQSGAESAARAAMDWEAAYEEKINELEQENQEIYRSIFQCGTGEKILAVTSAVYADGESMEADIYQYADGKIYYLGSVSSTGTAYPLAFTEEAVLFGGNHTAGKLVVHDETGELYQLENMNIEGKTPVLEIYDIINGEKTLKSSEEISADEADSYDYYTNAFADEKAEMIIFQ